MADEKLALPNDEEGNARIPRYRYTIELKKGEFKGASNSLLNNIVAPLDGKSGDGKEFVTTVPKIPIMCEEIQQ